MVASHERQFGGACAERADRPNLSAYPGSYALILRAFTHGVVRIGRRGCLSVAPGFYVYVGSAFGPGGVRARVAHHTRIAQRPHWHIDYLRRWALPEEAWYTHDACPREHDWADLFRQSAGASEPLYGFGTSDCQCRSHLFRFTRRPSLRSFCQRLGWAVPGHGAIEVMRSDGRQGFAEPSLAARSTNE
jgi:Uri superfamily endonuclease